eukprot:11210743-Lingulodinium_polyedra.AAC.1
MEQLFVVSVEAAARARGAAARAESRAVEAQRTAGHFCQRSFGDGARGSPLPRGGAGSLQGSLPARR